MQQGFPKELCIVDNDTEFVEFLSHYLDVRGCASTQFCSAEDMLKAGNFKSYDFFVIDLGLPGFDGVDLTTLIRAATDAGILVISSRLGADAFNAALTAGADMFIHKPVRFDQVCYAIQSIWRRMRAGATKLARNWRISADSSQLYAPGGVLIPLTPTEGRLIECLRLAGREPVSRADLAEACKVTKGASNRNLDAAIFRLRRKIELGTDLSSPFCTTHGLGYQLTTDIMDL